MKDIINNYKIPPNWIITSLVEVSEGENAIVDGPFGSNLKTSDYIDDTINGIPVLTTKNLEGNYSEKSVRYITKKKFEELKRSKVSPGDIIVAKIGSIGKTGIYPKNSKIAIIPANLLKFTVSKHVKFYYIYSYLNFSGFQNKLKKISTATAQPAFNVTKFRQIDIPLPPLPEQRTIVAKIEDLFSELEKGIESLKTAQQQLKIYRQSVLKYAFEGKLTEEWRKKNRKKLSIAKELLLQIERERENHYMQKMAEFNAGKLKDKPKKPKDVSTLTSDEINELPKLPTEWAWGKIGYITLGVEYGTSAKSNPTGKIPVLRMGNIKNEKGIFDWTDLVYTSDDEEIDKYLLKSKDVLFNRTNSPELVGKTAIYKGEKLAIFAGYLIRINQIHKLADANYLTYFLNSHFAKVYGNSVKTDGVNQSNINGEKLINYPFPLCQIDEQMQIVSEIEARFSVVDKLEETISDILNKAEIMRQSILKKAFEGKLLTEDELAETRKAPDWEPAEKLLERIKKETQSSTKIRSRKS